ncbi:MAG: class I SAM-dependent methyltransferase [Syntrophales bacterium]|nr:class I SAM-dependent methyltransferase [Syntrophales bacterium]
MINYLYRLIIDDVTDICYSNALDFFPDNSRILDVGIGNGIMLEQYHSLIRSKNLEITGIDINRQYLKHCKKMIRKCSLEDKIEVYYAPVESYSPPEDEYYDYILFGMSFMLFEDQNYVLDRVTPWIKPDGGMVFFQTMFEDRSVFLDIVKPRLKYFTTIDFGRVTYKEDFYNLLKEKELPVTEDRILKREWFKGDYHLIISKPKKRKRKAPFNFPKGRSAHPSHAGRTHNR